MSRIATMASTQTYISRMMATQKLVNQSQQQVFSGQVSQTYSGIDTDVTHLVNLENETMRIQKYQKNNEVAEMRVRTMADSMEAISDTVQNFRNRLSQFAARDLTTVDSDDAADIAVLQTEAFNAMKDIEYFLNQKLDGRYLFSGGRVDTAAVELDYSSLKDFQQTYDGENVTFPQTGAAHQSAFAVPAATAGDLTLTQIAAPSEEGTITAANADAFIKDSIPSSATATGDIAFSALTPQTISAQKEDAFSGFKPGDTLILDGTAPDPANLVPMTIESISADGRVITLSGTPLTTTETLAAGSDTTLKRTYPVGTTIKMDGVNATFDGNYTITGVNADNEIRVRTTSFPVGGTTYTPTAAEPIASSSYYQGDHHIFEHRLNDIRTVEVGITGEDPAFEKALRAMAIIAQDNMIDPDTDPATRDDLRTYNRVNEALALLDDAISHDSQNLSEDDSDVETLFFSIDGNLGTIQQTIDEQKDTITTIKVRTAQIEEIDPNLAAMNLNASMQTLEVSYAVLSRLNGLSLLNYI